MTNKLIEWFENCMKESNQFYIDDIKEEEGRLEEEMSEAECETEEEFLEFLNGQWEDPIEWYVFNFGEEDFGKACLVALGYKTWNDFR